MIGKPFLVTTIQTTRMGVVTPNLNSANNSYQAQKDWDALVSVYEIRKGSTRNRSDWREHTCGFTSAEVRDRTHTSEFTAE